MKDIITKEFYGENYYLVDIYENEFKLIQVYHFSTVEENIYCFLDNFEYKVIENKKLLNKINQELYIDYNIWHKFNIINPMMNITLKILGAAKKEKISKNELDEIYKKTAEYISTIHPSMNSEEIFKLINDGGDAFWVTNNKSEKRGFSDGMYMPLNNSLYLNKYNQNIENKTRQTFVDRTLTHELIHKIQNKKGNILNSFYKGIMEGATENAVEEIFKPKTSSVHSSNPKIQANVSADATYYTQTSFIKQMDVILGNDLIKKLAFTGDLGAVKEFKKQYGKDTFAFINHRMNRLLNPGINDEKQLQYIKEVQDTLLTKCFDKKHENINSFEDALSYMQELKKFESSRLKIQGDKTFEQYYKDKYNNLLERFKTASIETEALQEFEYKECKFNPTYSEEEKTKERITRHLNYIKHFETTTKEKINPSNLSRQIFYEENGDSSDILLYNGIPISNVYISDEDDPQSHNIKIQKNKAEGEDEITIPTLGGKKILLDCDGQIKMLSIDKKTGEQIVILGEKIETNISQEAINSAYKQQPQKTKKRGIFSKFLEKVSSKKTLKLDEGKNDAKTKSQTLQSWDLRNWTPEEIAACDDQTKKEDNLGKTNKYNKEDDKTL